MNKFVWSFSYDSLFENGEKKRKKKWNNADGGL